MTLPNLSDAFLLSYLQFREIVNTEQKKKKTLSIVLTLVSSYYILHLSTFKCNSPQKSAPEIPTQKSLKEAYGSRIFVYVKKYLTLP
jgi:hypothetical protein